MDDGQTRCVCGRCVVVTHPPAHAEIESAYFNDQRNVPCPRRVPTVSDPCLLEVYARHERERHGLYVVKKRCGAGQVLVNVGGGVRVGYFLARTA